MALDIKWIMIVIAYAIISNIVLLQIANLGIGIDCSNIGEFSLNGTIDYVNETDSNIETTRANIFDMALGRCDGLPTLLYWIVEVPVIIGILYIIRGFIGAT